MVDKVEKRSGEVVDYDKQKIVVAVVKAMNSLDEFPTDHEIGVKVARRVTTKLKKSPNDIPTVDEIHVLVENSLMDMKLYELAREYITYRDKNKPNIFKKRVAIKPYEYPQLIEYIEGIRHSYWIHTEFNYGPDIQDMKVSLLPHEVSVITKTMLAIGQIENAVKKFWGRIDDKLPKPEVSKVGATFSESEVRHEDAYTHLIEIMGLNHMFETLDQVPAMRSRIKYLEKVNQNNNSTDPREFFESIILFSMFIENVSLFSQFYIIMSFNKFRNCLKGMSNAVEATSKEEVLHAMFGFDLVNIIKKENPNWWDDDLVEYIKDMTKEALEAEFEVIDWIYEDGDTDSAPKEVVKGLVKSRMNDSLAAINIEPIFDIKPEIMEKFEWFDDELLTTKNGDFFNKRQINYTKRSTSVTADDLGFD